MAIALGPIQQAATGSVAAGGMMNSGGVAAGGMNAGTLNPDYPGGGRRPDPRDITNAWLALQLTLLMKSAANVLTQQYQDNADNDKKKCELFPYSERDKKCPKGMTDVSTNAHHAIPDHCWRAGGITQNTINSGLKNVGEQPGLTGKLIEYFGMNASQSLDEMLPGGSYYHHKVDPTTGKTTPKMSKEKGLAICVTGKGKNLQHGAIHKSMDALEDDLGAKGNPKYTATLEDMENAAAESISKVTGCDKQNLKDQLRKYHNDLGFTDPKNTLLRADSGGRNTSQWGKDPILGRGTNTGGTRR